MFLRLFLVLVLSVAVAGCPELPSFGECAVDNDCNRPLLCLEETCVSPADGGAGGSAGAAGSGGSAGSAGAAGSGGSAGAAGMAGNGGQGGSGTTLDAGAIADSGTPVQDMTMPESDGAAVLFDLGGTADGSLDAARAAVDAAPLAPCGMSCPDLDFVAISGGEFQRGNEARPTERPIHRVNVPNFEMMRAEVSVAQYRACVIAGACDEPQTGHTFNWSADAAARENHPINGVSWDNAHQFAAWVGARLPSEAEWEYAARSGGQNITYPWGEAGPTCNHADFHRDDGSCRGIGTSAICTHAAGHTVQGLCNLAGNVWEWVEDDWHGSYEGAMDDGSAWVDNARSADRVVRGGSWNSIAGALRAAGRSRSPPYAQAVGGGFRLAK